MRKRSLRKAKAFWVLMARLAGWNGPAVSAGAAPTPSEFRIYPNPAGETVYLEIDASAADAASFVSVTDVTGREMCRMTPAHPAGASGNDISFSVGHWPDGIYALRCRTRLGMVAGRLFVLH